jgi:hypothetical protein
MDWRRMRDNPGEMAAWMLHLVDGSPDRLGIIEVPHTAVRTGEDGNATEAVVGRQFDRAKAERPDLSVKIGPPNEKTPNSGTALYRAGQIRRGTTRTSTVARERPPRGVWDSATQDEADTVKLFA